MSSKASTKTAKPPPEPKKVKPPSVREQLAMARALRRKRQLPEAPAEDEETSEE